MNAPVRIEPADDITVFLGDIPADEYEQRRRIRSARNCASFKTTQTESEPARQLAWLACDFASVWIYRPASIDELTEVAKLLRRLLTVADQAEQIEGWLS